MENQIRQDSQSKQEPFTSGNSLLQPTIRSSELETSDQDKPFDPPIWMIVMGLLFAIFVAAATLWVMQNTNIAKF